MADTFVELQVTDKETGKVLGARVISVLEEKAVLLSLFQEKWVPLTYTMLLGESDEDMDPLNSLWDGGTYSTTCPLHFPEASRFEIWYSTFLGVRQRTPYATGKRELAMRLSFVGFQWETLKEVKFDSILEVWGFLDFLLAAKPLWDME